MCNWEAHKKLSQKEAGEASYCGGGRPITDPIISIRHDLRPGDVGFITYLHAILYVPEQGWDYTFEAYVAIPLIEFAKLRSSRHRIWIVENERRIVGSVANCEVFRERGSAPLAAPVFGGERHGARAKARRRGV